MSIIDSLILANLALLSLVIYRNSFYDLLFFRIVAEIFTIIPVLGLFSFIIYKLLKKPLKPVLIPIKQTLLQVKPQLLLIYCNGHNGNGARDEVHNKNGDEIQLPDRFVHPELYTQEEN